MTPSGLPPSPSLLPSLLSLFFNTRDSLWWISEHFASFNPKVKGRIYSLSGWRTTLTSVCPPTTDVFIHIIKWGTMSKSIRLKDPSIIETQISDWKADLLQGSVVLFSSLALLNSIYWTRNKGTVFLALRSVKTFISSPNKTHLMNEEAHKFS